MFYSFVLIFHSSRGRGEEWDFSHILCMLTTAENEVRFLAFSLDKIYRIKAIGLSMSNNTLKIMIFGSTWNWGSFCEIFCQLILNPKNHLLICNTYNYMYDYLPHSIGVFIFTWSIFRYLINFQRKTNFSPSKFCIFDS